MKLGDVIQSGRDSAFEQFLQLLAEALRTFGAGSEAYRKAHTAETHGSPTSTLHQPATI